MNGFSLVAKKATTVVGHPCHPRIQDRRLHHLQDSLVYDGPYLALVRYGDGVLLSRLETTILMGGYRVTVPDSYTNYRDIGYRMKGICRYVGDTEDTEDIVVNDWGVKGGRMKSNGMVLVVD